MVKKIDIPNFGLTAGEYIQDIRDREIPLGISAVAGFLEDLAKPDFKAFERARWSAITDVVAMGDDAWQTVQVDSENAINRKNKITAVIVGVSQLALKECREALGGDSAWPAVGFSYKGVDRVGLLPTGFGEIDDYAAVGMLMGRNNFAVSQGLATLRADGQVRALYGKPRRSDLSRATLYIPVGVTVLDEVPADQMPPNVPLV